MSDTYVSTYPNRTLCDVLDEMRKCNKVRNYSILLSLIEEAQTFGNRMEAGLSDQRDYRDMNKAIHELKKVYRPLSKEVDELEKKKKALEEEIEKLKGAKDVNDNSTK